MSGPRVYIHEFVDIIGHHRARYMYHMTARWGPVGRAERQQLCFGVWATVGSTGRWPQVVNLWEYENWDALGHNFEVELTGDGLQDPSLEQWWAEAASMRSGGVDRILVAPNWSPSVADHEAGNRQQLGADPAAGYVHEMVRTAPGGVDALLAEVQTSGVGARVEAGYQLVGAFGRALGNDDECVLIWSFPTWATWSSDASDPHGPVARWWTARRNAVVYREQVLLADAPLSPLRTGRQPQESDRLD